MEDAMKKIFTIVGGLLLVIAILAAVGLGIWAYTLNTKLNAAQKQLASLQGDYNKLKSDNTQLTSNLNQTNSTLDQSKSDLAKTQSDLATANSDKTALQAKIDMAKKYMTVVDAVFVTQENDAGVTAKILATGDTTLINLLDTVTRLQVMPITRLS